ncbi:hypothetical protein KJ616_02590 [Patescibacteria group bacterium]|nr:hypothetical protein [Patescibacteria group bacterium]
MKIDIEEHMVCFDTGLYYTRVLYPARIALISIAGLKVNIFIAGLVAIVDIILTYLFGRYMRKRGAIKNRQRIMAEENPHAISVIDYLDRIEKMLKKPLNANRDKNIE